MLFHFTSFLCKFPNGFGFWLVFNTNIIFGRKNWSASIWWSGWTPCKVLYGPGCSMVQGDETDPDKESDQGTMVMGKGQFCYMDKPWNKYLFMFLPQIVSMCATAVQHIVQSTPDDLGSNPSSSPHNKHYYLLLHLIKRGRCPAYTMGLQNHSCWPWRTPV